MFVEGVGLAIKLSITPQTIQSHVEGNLCYFGSWDNSTGVRVHKLKKINKRSDFDLLDYLIVSQSCGDFLKD